MISHRYIALLALLLVPACLSAPLTRFNSQKDLATTRTRYEFAFSFESFPSGSVNKAYAPPQNLMTGFTSDATPEFHILWDEQPGSSQPYAYWNSYLVDEEGDRWSEAGNITFHYNGKENTVYFASNGLSGEQLGNFSDLNYGCITYNITGGTGDFSNCYGMMVDTFVDINPYDPSAPFEINAWGIFWV